MVWVAEGSEHRTDCRKPLSKSLLVKFELRFANTSSWLFSSWAEAAMMWVAEESEHRTEREKLANAMAVSLAEEDERKTSAVPLQDRPDAELRQRFAASLLMPQVRKYMDHKIAGSGKWGRQQQRHDWDVQRLAGVRSAAGLLFCVPELNHLKRPALRCLQFEGTSFGGALFALPALRSALVRLLELERQICCQWCVIALWENSARSLAYQRGYRGSPISMQARLSRA